MASLSADPFNLDRFVEAQEPIFATALDELRAGQKRSHWMWFVFPQLQGLGHSPLASFYGIASCDEAMAYLAHPVLGSRLILCTETVLAVKGRTLNDIFGSPDDLKFHSCMTLFAMASEESHDSTFRRAIDRYCDGRPDQRTLTLLGKTAAD
jgi:uncharacterized protein (DUF1810 family)